MTDSTRLAEALRPCPSCGSDAIRIGDRERSQWYVCCDNCRACIDFRTSKDGAIEAWNDRAAHDAQRAESVADPEWLRDLKHELLRSKMTHNFTLSRDELTHILGGPFALMAQASQGKRAESGAGVPVVSAKPIEWHEEVYAGDKEWFEDYYGFHIVFDKEEPAESDAAYNASWGEGDSENFGTLEEAQKWCQDLIDEWVRGCAVLAAAPEKDHGAPQKRKGEVLDLQREALLARARKQRADIQQIFDDVDHWNRKYPTLKPVVADADGQLRRIADGLDQMLAAETKEPRA